MSLWRRDEMKNKVIVFVGIFIFASFLLKMLSMCERDREERRYREETIQKLEAAREAARQASENRARKSEQEALAEYESKRTEISKARDELVIEAVSNDDGDHVDDGLRAIAEDAYRRFVCEPAGSYGDTM